MFVQLAKACEVKPGTGEDHFYKVLRAMAQWELLDELPERRFAANAATLELVSHEYHFGSELFTLLLTDGL